MSFISALAAIGEGAALAGGALATGASALGSGLAAGAGAIGTGLAAGAGAIGTGAAELGSGIASGLAGGAETAGAAGAAGEAGTAGVAANLGADISAPTLLGGTETAGTAGFGGGALQAGTGAVADTSAGASTLGSSGFGATPAQIAASNMAPSLGVDTTPTLFQGANAANAANLGFGQGALNTGLNAVNITNPVAQNMIYGGLKGAAIGAGVGGLGSALTGQDIGKGMEGGALTGAIGGIGGAGLSGLTGSSNATLSDIGDFATKHDTLVPAGISLAATPFVNNALSPSIPTTQGSTYSTPLHWAGPKPGVFNQTTYSPDIPNPASFYPTSSGYAEGGITNLAAGGMPKYAPAGLPAGLPEGLPSKIQHLAPKGHPANTRYSHSIGMAQGGIADLGSYKSGGSPNLLHGPGDGVSDDIPATIANKQPARLATGEYVLSSRIVSELGNGSTDAGAKRLDEMVKHIQAGRKKTIGKNKEYAKDTKAYKHLLA